MRELTEIRDDIDVIDSSILSIFKDRMKLAAEVAENKMQTGKAVLDRKREEEKLEKLCAGADDDFIRVGIYELFELIMSISRKKQYQLIAKSSMSDFGYKKVDSYRTDNVTVVYQGVEGAYSYAALKDYFPEGTANFSVKTWREAMDALSRGEADYGVLPIENSTYGAVGEMYDLLSEYDLSVIGEEILSIDHALLGVPGSSISDIRTVYSHSQALGQCSAFLDEHPDWQRESALNTAVSAKMVADSGDKSVAAIAGAVNASLYGLEVLQEHIQNEKNNQTRFFVLSAKKIYKNDADKISISFELPNKEGALYRILSHFAFNSINMCRIESRPIPSKLFEYRFFIDVEGRLMDEGMQNALLGLREEASNLRILGHYR